MNKPNGKKRITDDATVEMTLRDSLMPVFRQWRTALTTFLSVVVLTTLIAWIWAANYYTSSFQVVVEQARIDPTVTTGQSANINSHAVTTDQVASEVALLQGTDMLHAVVSVCGLASKPSLLEDIFPPKDPAKSRALREESATRRLGKKLTVEAEKTSDVIDVSYGKMDVPETPACVLQTLSKLYLEKHVQLERPAGTSDFFASEAAKYEQALAKSEKRLYNFSRVNGGAAPDLVRGDMAQQLANSEAALDQAHEMIAADEKRIQSIRAQMGVTPSRSSTTEVTNSSNLLLQNLQAALLAAQVRRTQLLIKFEPTYPLVREVDQEIEQTQNAIVRAQESHFVNRTTDRDPTYEFLREDLAKTQADLASANATASALSPSIKSIQQQMVKLDQQAVEQSAIIREVKANEGNYLLYLTKREQERSSDALDKKGIANVAIAVPPSIPLLPAHSPWLVMLLGCILALIAGLASAFLSEYFDRSFRTPSEVEDCLDIPVLACLPRRAA